MTRSNAICLIGGIIIGLLLMVFFRSFEPKKPENDIILRKSLEQRDNEIKELKSDNEKLSILASKENDTVIIIQKEYVKIYRNIDHSNRAELDRAFDSLLTD